MINKKIKRLCTVMERTADACYEYVMTSFENKQRDTIPFRMKFAYPRNSKVGTTPLTMAEYLLRSRGAGAGILGYTPPLTPAEWLLGSRGAGVGILRALARIQKRGFVIDLSIQKRKNKRPKKVIDTLLCLSYSFTTQ